MGKLWDIVQAHRDAQKYPPSERQIARALDISPTALSNWREPKALPSAKNLRALAQLAGVPYSAVLEAALEDTGYKGGGRRGDAAAKTQAGESPAPTASATIDAPGLSTDLATGLARPAERRAGTPHRGSSQEG